MMTRAPDVSIIVPVHNRAVLLAEALGSVAASIGDSITCEILVIDDASNPLEAAEIKALCAASPYCCYFRLEKNSGPQIARNMALDLATGRYIKFLDSDDVLLPGALGREVNRIESSGADLLICGWLKAAMGDTNLEHASSKTPPKYAGNPYDAILSGFGAPISAVLYKRSAIGAERWDTRVRHPDDWFFLIKVLLKNPTVAAWDAPAFIWREHAGARQSSTSLIDYAHSRFTILEFLYRAMQDSGVLTKPRRVALANYVFRDIYIAHRFDAAHYRLLLQRVEEIVPGFRTSTRIENSLPAYVLRLMLGHRVYIPIHTTLRRIANLRRER
jgi:glycosyltransferase involved in cell wall biosynthesis